MSEHVMTSRAMTVGSDAAKSITDITSPSTPQSAGDRKAVPVSAGGKIFQVDRGFLVRSSKFFQAAMKEVWRTDIAKPINVFDTKASSFEIYLDWLLASIAPETSGTGDMHYEDLAELYILGDKIIDAQFQNIVMTSIIESFKTTAPDMKSIRIMYKGTPASSLGRRILVDRCAWDMEHGAKCLKDLDPEQDAGFSVDLIREMIAYRPRVYRGFSRPWNAHQGSYMRGRYLACSALARQAFYRQPRCIHLMILQSVPCGLAS